MGSLVLCSIDIAVTELLGLGGQKSTFSILGKVLKTAIFENKVPWAMNDGKIGASGHIKGNED